MSVKFARYAKELLRFNEAGVEVVVKASFNIWSKLLTYLYDSISPKYFDTASFKCF